MFCHQRLVGPWNGIIRGAVALILSLAPLLSQAIVVRPGLGAQDRLREALALVQPGEIIHLAAGVFRLEESLTVAVESSILRGAGRNRTILIFRPEAVVDAGLKVRANGVQLQGFSLQEMSGVGIHVDYCTDILIADVGVQWSGGSEASGTAYNGLEIIQSQDVLVEKFQASGSAAAGILIQDSTRVLLRNSQLEENRTGVRVQDSMQVDLRDSILQLNGTGIHVIESGDSVGPRRVRIFGNRIGENNYLALPPGGELLPAPRGAGVVITGGRDIEIFGNDIRNHGSFNVLVRTAIDDGFPDRIHIRDNQQGRSGYAPDIQHVAAMIQAGGGRLASIVWDGEVPWQEMMGIQPRAGRVVLGRNAGADFVDLDMPWFRTIKALHRSRRDYNSYVGSLRPLPDFFFISNKIRSLATRCEPDASPADTAPTSAPPPLPDSRACF